MKRPWLPARPVSLCLSSCLLAVLVLLTGCFSDDDYTKTVTQFQQASASLTQAYQSFLTNANIVEESSFIDSQVFEAKPLDPASIRSQDLLTPDEIKLRISAIKALSDYTTALATLASGKPAPQTQADATKASASLKTLTSDATKALAHPTAHSKTPNFADPVSSAASAIGDIIVLLEKRHAQAELRDSLTRNDPQVKALFDLIGKESRELYARRKSTLGATGVTLFEDYDTARQARPVNSATLLELSDRIKQYQSESAILGDSDPAKAIEAFQQSHDALVDAILAPKEKKKQSLAQLIDAVKSFATEVTPLSQDLYGIGKSL